MASFNNFNPIPLIIALFFSLQFSITKALHVLGEELIHRSDNTKDLNLVRIECMLIIFATTFTCALLPYFFRRNANFLLLGPPFSVGVFGFTSLNFRSNSIGGKYFPSFLILLGYFLTGFGEIILVKILKKKKKKTTTTTTLEAPVVVDVEERRNAAAAMVVVEKESVNARVAAVGVTVLIISGFAINSFHEGIQIGQRRRAWRLLWPISLNHALLAIALGIVALRMQPRRPFLTLVAYSFAFAISTPVGILTALSKDDDFFVGSIFDDLLIGIFSGVFLYISINHLTAKGLKPQEPQCSYDTPFRNFWVVILVIGVRLFGAVIFGWLFWLL